MTKSKLTAVPATHVIPSLTDSEKLQSKQQPSSKSVKSVPELKQAFPDIGSEGKVDIPTPQPSFQTSHVVDKVCPKTVDKLTSKPKLTRDYSVEVHSDEDSSPNEIKTALNGYTLFKPKDDGIIDTGESQVPTPLRKTKSLKALSLMYAVEEDDFFSQSTSAPYASSISAQSPAPETLPQSPPVKEQTLRSSLKSLSSHYSMDESSSSSPNQAHVGSGNFETDVEKEGLKGKDEEVMTVVDIGGVGSSSETVSGSLINRVEREDVCFEADLFKVDEDKSSDKEENSVQDKAEDEREKSCSDEDSGKEVAKGKGEKSDKEASTDDENSQSGMALPCQEDSTAAPKACDVYVTVPDDADNATEKRLKPKLRCLDSLDVDEGLETLPMITVTSPGGSWRERITSTEDLITSSENESTDDEEHGNSHLSVSSDEEGRVGIKVESKDPDKSKESPLKDVCGKSVSQTKVFPYEVEECEEPDIVKPPQDCRAVVNGIACFEVKVTGNPTPSVKWFKNEVEVNDPRMNSVVSNGCSYSLIITDVTKGDEGMYTCTAKSMLGLDSATAELIVEGWLTN